MEKVERAELDWVRGFGRGLLCVMGVRLRDCVALLRGERSLRAALPLPAAPSHALRRLQHSRLAPAALRPVLATSEANLAAFGANLDPTDVVFDADSLAVTDVDIDEPNAAPVDDDVDSDEDEVLFLESEMEVARRVDKVERDIEVAAQVHEVAWRWVGAHLDHYAHIWRKRFREKGVGEIGLWKELIELRREMDVLEEVLGLSTTATGISN